MSYITKSIIIVIQYHGIELLIMNYQLVEIRVKYYLILPIMRHHINAMNILIIYVINKVMQMLNLQEILRYIYTIQDNIAELILKKQILKENH